MIKFYHIPILVFFLFSAVLPAQQLPIFAQYRDGQSFFNPASISGNYFKYYQNVTAGLFYRSQWKQVKDAPRTALADFEFYNEDIGIVFGGHLTRDQTGPTGFTGAYGRFAYAIDINNELQLVAGLSAGLVQYKVDGADLQFFQPGDVAAENQTKFFPDFGLGAMLYYDERFYAGISIPQTFGLDLQFKNNANDFRIQRLRHYYLTGGAYVGFSNDSWLEPSFWLKYVPDGTIHLDANLKYEFSDLLWLGFGGSSTGAIQFEVGFFRYFGGDFNNSALFKMGYSYTQFNKTFGPEFGGSHEIRLSYSWKY